MFLRPCWSPKSEKMTLQGVRANDEKELHLLGNENSMQPDASFCNDTSVKVQFWLESRMS